MAGRQAEAGRRLLPVVVVDVVAGEPLMLAYAGEEEIRLSIESGLAWFYSRSRGERWLKGSSSGGVLRVVRVVYDCDRDAVAYVAYTDRHVCHLGRRSCFHNVEHDNMPVLLAGLIEETWPHSRPTPAGHPLATWTPPPSPLLAALAARLLAERLRRHGVNAVLAPAQPPPILAALAAQATPAALHVSPSPGAAPESIGELDRVAVVAPAAGEAEQLAAAAARRGARVEAVIAVADTREPRGGCLVVKLDERSGGRAQPRPGSCVQ